MDISTALKKLREYAVCGLAANSRDTKQASEWVGAVKSALNQESERLIYLLKINQADSLYAAIIGFVGPGLVKGKRQCNDNDTDYFDHYFVDQQCWEDNCSGDAYYPLDDGCTTYVRIAFQC